MLLPTETEAERLSKLTLSERQAEAEKQFSDDVAHERAEQVEHAALNSEALTALLGSVSLMNTDVFDNILEVNGIELPTNRPMEASLSELQPLVDDINRINPTLGATLSNVALSEWNNQTL